MEQQILVDPIKLTPEQVNDRAQRLVDALMQRDLLVIEAKNAATAAKEEITELDKRINQLRGEIRESRPSPTFKSVVASLQAAPLCIGIEAEDPETQIPESENVVAFVAPTSPAPEKA